MNLSALLYLVALVLFVVAVFATVEFNLIAAGLACVAGGLLVSTSGNDRRLG